MLESFGVYNKLWLIKVSMHCFLKILFLKNILERGFQTTENGAALGGSLTSILAG